MHQAVTHILAERYGIDAKTGQKTECPFCHHRSFSIKSDDSIGKCFHPDCAQVIKSGIRGGGSIKPRETGATVQPLGGCTLVEYSEAKKLPLDFLKKIGVSQISFSGLPAIRIPYYDENRNEMAIRFRTALDKAETDIRFKWKKGSKPCPYGLWKLDMAKKEGYLILVEGESDAQTLWFHEIPALGIPGANSWKQEWSSYIDGISKIYVIIEPDSGGQAVLKWLQYSEIEDRVMLINLADHKDPSGLYLADPENFRVNWQRCIDSAILYDEFHSLIKKQKADHAWHKCESLAKQPNILDVFIRILHEEMGVVAETRLAKLIFLALISRFLDRPISISVRGPSSAGKSFIVEKVLTFFPASAYYALTAMSDRVLVYSTEPLSHRYLVLYEYSGAQSDMQNYLIRSLLSEGHIRYETVEKTTDGLKSRFIEKEGPTGLILTTTAVHLHPENETRLLTVHVSDSQEQTRFILMSLANRNGTVVDLSIWHALHEWLESAIHKVEIPYAKQIAEKIPPVAVRLRRDFAQVLNLIRAHAILYQAQREIHAGKIVATWNDYTTVRDLMNDLISDEIEMTVPATLRETVDAVSALAKAGHEEVCIVDVAKQLKMDKSSAQRRVYAAISRGYLRNLEEKKGRPARLVIGDKMPEDIAILPPAETIGGCTVAVDQEG